MPSGTVKSRQLLWLVFAILVGCLSQTASTRELKQSSGVQISLNISSFGADDWVQVYELSVIRSNLTMCCLCVPVVT